MILSKRKISSAVLGLMTGGVLGDVYDRVQRGKATDFIDLNVGSWHWPTFNIADGAIVRGANFLILLSRRPSTSRITPD